MGNIDLLCNENIELNKLNQSMSVELKTVKESLTKAEQALETEKQSKIDALREFKDRLDKRLDESVAIDSQLLSKSYLKDPVLIIFAKVNEIVLNFYYLLCQLQRAMAMSLQRITGLTGFWRWESYSQGSCLRTEHLFRSTSPATMSLLLTSQACQLSWTKQLRHLMNSFDPASGEARRRLSA